MQRAVAWYRPIQSLIWVPLLQLSRSLNAVYRAVIVQRLMCRNCMGPGTRVNVATTGLAIIKHFPNKPRTKALLICQDGMWNNPSAS